MIPAAFDYVAPTSVDEALQALAQAASDGKDVKVLGGGQSLIPVLRLRMAAPELLVDLSKVDGLRGVRDDGDALVIGAMTTHDQVAKDASIKEHAAAAVEGGRDRRRPAGAAPRHLRRRARARRPGRRPARSRTGSGRRDGDRRAGRRAPHRPGRGVLPGPVHHRRGRGRAAGRGADARSTPAGARTTRSSRGSRTPGRSSASPRRCGSRAARSPRPGWR